jgi:transaldolase
MKIFLDTANREVIKKWLPTGLIDGVTTNPSLLSKEGSSPRQVLLDICAMVPGPVSIEVVDKDPNNVYKQAMEIAAFAKNVVVKIPCLQEYLPIMNMLIKAGVKINATLVFSTIQMILMAKIGATFISPFVGRWDDIGEEGVILLDEMVEIKRNYEFTAEILAASVRSVYHWRRAAIAGVDIVTLPPGVIEQGIKHPLTDRGVELFDNDWKKLGRKNLFE